MINCGNIKKEGLLKLKNEINGKEVNLKIIQVKGDKASDLYVKNKIKAGKMCGIKIEHILFEEDITTEKLIKVIENFNNDKNVNGIMLQLPVPQSIDSAKVINAIDPLKDVDGLTPINLGKIMINEEGLRSCTAQGVMKILNEVIGLNNLEGKNVTIIGRTKLVGLPLFHMLLNLNATPVICHTKTKYLSKYTKNADILITAAGAKKPFIGNNMIKDEAIIIDVSTVKGDDGKFHGDVIFDEVKDKASYVTPVPGGVGQLTVLELMNNTYKAYKLQNEL